MPMTERVEKLIEARGLDVELLESYGVTGSDRQGFDIVFPYFQGGQMVGRKHRRVEKLDDGKPNFVQDKGSKQVLWNGDVLLDHTLDHLPLYITEGEFDALAAIQAGYLRTVSVPNGCPLPGEHEGGRYEYLEAVRAVDCKEIVLAVDKDEPGKLLLQALGMKLGRDRCKWIPYPKDCKDLNDALRIYGSAGVVQSLNRARFIDLPGLYSLSELPPLPYHQPHDVGIPGLEKHYNARLGDFVALTGIPNHGKSSLAIAVAAHLALRHKWPALIASFEMRPQVELRRALRTWYNSKLEKDQDSQEQSAADQWMEEYFKVITASETENMDLGWLLERMRASVTRYGSKTIVVDPWNELDHDDTDFSTKTDYVGSSIRLLKKFAMHNAVHLIVVAHPAKMQRNRSGKYPVPTLYDIADSAHWANKPDVGIVVHRQSDQETLIKIVKSRFQDQIGEVGDISVRWERERATYERFVG